MHHCTSTDLISYPVISVSLNLLTSNQLMCVYDAVRTKFLNIHLSCSVPCLKWWDRSFQNLLLKFNSHTPCCAHAVPLPCSFAKDLGCVCPVLIYTVRPCLIQTWRDAPLSCHDHAVLKATLKGTARHAMGGSWAWHVWVSIVRPGTAAGRSASFRILPTTTRITTKFVIRSIIIP
jgi:hypothetical protein